MMNINLFWKDKGYDPQEIQESAAKGYQISRDLVIRDNAGMALQVLCKWVTRYGPPKYNPLSQRISFTTETAIYR